MVGFTEGVSLNILFDVFFNLVDTLDTWEYIGVCVGYSHIGGNPSLPFLVMLFSSTLWPYDNRFLFNAIFICLETCMQYSVTFVSTWELYWWCIYYLGWKSNCSLIYTYVGSPLTTLFCAHPWDVYFDQQRIWKLRYTKARLAMVLNFVPSSFLLPVLASFTAVTILYLKS